jgi:hypothetical protein
MNESTSHASPAAATETCASNALMHQDSANANTAATNTAATAGATTRTAAPSSAFSSLNIGSDAALTEGDFPSCSSNTRAGSADKGDQKIDATYSARSNEDDYVDPDQRTSGVSAKYPPTIQVYVQMMIDKELLVGTEGLFTLTFESAPSMLDVANAWKTKAVQRQNPKFLDVDFRLPKVYPHPPGKANFLVLTDMWSAERGGDEQGRPLTVRVSTTEGTYET